MNHVGISPYSQEVFTVLRYETKFILNDASAFNTKALHSEMHIVKPLQT